MIRKGVWWVFFFSSRRRHTRFDCDWSSDVCSSDLAEVGGQPFANQCAAVFHVFTKPLDGRALQHHRIGQVNNLVLRRSEEHTSELQSQSNLVCRLLLENKSIDSNLDPVTPIPSPAL